MNCVLVGDRHQGLGEGIRGLLESTFSAVVRVADAVSLVEGAARLQPEVVIVELALADGDLRRLVTALRGAAPSAKVLLLSAHDQSGVAALALDAGVDGFVLKRLIAGDLLAAIDALLAGDRYVSSGVVV
ncbi:response regulator [Variovorax sp. J31P207]|uniref:response regulator n=1 Tax=Variovorax sp. J31P207 TaxID=3053510 RepID=UPI002578817C|nr:response regulator [Variovorax sp. J31P207]MDM0072476.1 response regulator [Variovorax sp. J31P207]